MKNDFEYWLTNIAKKKNGEAYSEQSIYKYVSSIDVIDREFGTNLWKYENLNSLFQIKSNLYTNKDFIKKNTRGNRMYSRSVEMFADYIYSKSIELVNDDIEQIENNNTLSYDEKNSYIETICNMRNPQFQRNFRKELLNEFNSKCALCDINDKRFLVASHIIPYSDCKIKSDMYRSYNGLLLCVMHDALFDKHCISFDSDGNIVINNTIENKMYDFFDINISLELDNKFLSSKRKKCLLSHMSRFEEKTRGVKL